MIGILGDIPFFLNFDGSSVKGINFKDLKKNGRTNYQKHRRRNQKPVMELADFSLDKLSLETTLRSDFGIQPKELLKKLITYTESGEVLEFILGEESFGKYVIASYEAGYEYITSRGKVRKIDVTLSLEEYTDSLQSNISVVKKEKKKIQKKSVHEDFNQGAISP